MVKIGLNPAYLLRQDGNRVILSSHSEGDWGVDDWFSFVHPYQAMMLSFFRGERDFESELVECATFFGLPLEKMREIIQPYIDNSSWFGIRHKNGRYVNFPKRLLIEFRDECKRDAYYTPADFEFCGEPDYDTLRLCYPVRVNMELTMKCYVSCCYCYAKRNMSDGGLMEKELLLDFIRQAKRDGVLHIDINGGEVLLHPNIREILQELVRNNYEPLISTKMPVEKDMIDFIQVIGLKKIQISLDSVVPKTLTKIIGVGDGYLEDMTRTLAHLSQVSQPTDINVVLTQFNSSFEEIELLLNFLAQFDAVKNVRFNSCGYSLYKEGFDDLVLSVKQIKSVELYIDELRNKYPGLRIAFSGYDSGDEYEPSNKERTFHKRAICTGNVRNVVLLPNGDITICEELYDHPAFILGNIRRNTLKQIWNSPKALSLFEFPLNSDSDSTCNTCETVRECRYNEGVCWKTVLMAYGMDNWDYPDPRCPKAKPPFRNFFSK